MDKDFPCDKCPEHCCGTVPFSRQDIKNLKAKSKKLLRGIKEVPYLDGFLLIPNKTKYEVGNESNLFSTDCIFKTDLGCSIYELRPQVCKDFGNVDRLRCPFEHGIPETKEEQKKLIMKTQEDNMKEVFKGSRFIPNMIPESSKNVKR